MRICHWLAASTAMLAAAPAWAQAADEPVPDQADIVVTATKRAVALDRSAGSITALSSEALAARSVSTVDEAFNSVANVRFETTTQSGPQVNIRGVNNQTNGVGFEPGVSVYIDEVYQPRPSSFTSVLADIERVEVLRGPQGTVFGKNTIGGLIHLVTKKPTQDFEASGDLTYGSRDLAQARLTLNAPLGPKAALRVTGIAKSVDGWERNRTPGAPALYGESFGGLRAHLLVTPAETVEVLLSGDYAKTKGTGDQHLDIDGDPRDRVTSVGPNGGFDRTAYGFSGRISADLGKVELVSLSAYRRNDSTARFDQDFTPAPGILTRFPELDRNFSQELRLVSDLDGPFDFILGAYYLHDHTTNAIQALFGNDLGPVTAQVDTNIVTRSYAGFASTDVKLSDRLTLTGGARYTREKKRFDFLTRSGAPLPVGTAQGATGLSDGAWSGDLGVNYQATRSLFLYAKFAHGFKAGGFDNVSAFQSGALTTIATGGAIPFDIDQFVFRPEQADNYEAGLKLASANGRYHVYGSGFFTKYRDKQEQITRLAVLGGITVPLATTANAGKVDLKGFELEAAAAPVPWWRVDASLGYLDARYTAFVDPAGQVDRTGLRLTRAPRWSGSVASTWLFPGPASTEGSLRAEADYRSKSFLNADNNAFAVQAKHVLLNFRAGLEASDKRYGLFVFGKNVTNAKVFLAAEQGLNGAIPIPPSAYGIEFRFRFQ